MRGPRRRRPEWANLSLQDTATQINQYAFATAQYFQSQGLNVEVYDVGNEIDTGIVGFRPGERIALPGGIDVTCDVHRMHDNIWVPEATLLQAAVSGIRRANPGAKIAALDLLRRILSERACRRER